MYAELLVHRSVAEHAPEDPPDEKKAKKASAKKPIRTYNAALKFLFSQTDYEQMLRVRYNRDTFSLDRMKALLKKYGPVS